MARFARLFFIVTKDRVPPNLFLYFSNPSPVFDIFYRAHDSKSHDSASQFPIPVSLDVATATVEFFTEIF